MPPKARISKEMILDTVLGLAREDGFDTVNARRIVDRMNCSTQPIFTCYENMEELKRDFLEFAFAFYQQYVADYEKSSWVEPVFDSAPFLSSICQGGNIFISAAVYK